MPALTFRITLEQPVLIGKIGSGDENSAVSYNYLPGSAIRGMLIKRFIRKHKQIDPAAVGTNDALFFDGRLCFLNAYPLTEKDERTLPTPRSWRVEKQDAESKTAEISDLAITQYAPLETPIALPAPFCHYRRTEAVLYTPPRVSGMHNASEQRGVKQEGQSTVFRYDALAASQQFGGVILCDSRVILDDVLKPLLTPSTFWIGRSRSAGYGQIYIDQIDVREFWQEYQPELTTSHLVLTFLSDALLRDVNGQWTTNVDNAAELPTRPQHTFVGTEIVGGFNRKWGLPLPQVPVISAGSVLVFNHDPVLHSQLEALASTGIGERRNEGFGRIAINWHTSEQVAQSSTIPTRKLNKPVALDGADRNLARRMVERLYRVELDKKLTIQIAGALAIEGNIPENAQLSRLRIMARRAWHEQNSELFLTYLQHTKSTAKQQLNRSRVGQQSFYQWLEKGWQGQIWTDYFGMAESEKPAIGDVVAQDSPDLKLEYTARLVDALCNKTIKTRAPKEVA